MLEFMAALAAFLVSHSIPASPGVRARLVARLGERGYLIGYSLLSLGLLAWLIGAAARAPVIVLWDLQLWQYHVPVTLMLPAFLLLAGGAISANPLSISFSRRRFDPERPGIVAITRHPILWAFVLWAFAHVIPNGDLVPVIMFGGFGSFALLAMPMIDSRKRRAMGARWQELARPTSVVPFAAVLAGRTPMRWRARELAATILVGCALYLALLWAHPVLFGPDPRIVFG